jgi:transketolase
MDKKLIKLIEDNNIQLHGDIEYFAELIAAAEREACAQMFDGNVWAYDYREIAAAIRARGQE